MIFLMALSYDLKRTIIDVNSFLFELSGFFNDNLGHASRTPQMSEQLREGSNAFKIEKDMHCIFNLLLIFMNPGIKTSLFSIEFSYVSLCG